MAKKKKVELTYDSAKEELIAVKGSLKEVAEERRAFLKDNKLKKTEDHSKSKDKKIAAAYSKQQKAIDTLSDQKQELITFMKENKPKTERVTKYAYPAGINAEERKKFRANCRASAKRAKVDLETYLADPEKHDKADTAAKPAKKAKAPAKKEKPAKEAKAEKPKKKKKASKDD